MIIELNKEILQLILKYYEIEGLKATKIRKAYYEIAANLKDEQKAIERKIADYIRFQMV